MATRANHDGYNHGIKNSALPRVIIVKIRLTIIFELPRNRDYNEHRHLSENLIDI